MQNIKGLGMRLLCIGAVLMVVLSFGASFFADGGEGGSSSGVMPESFSSSDPSSLPSVPPQNTPPAPQPAPAPMPMGVLGTNLGVTATITPVASWADDRLGAGTGSAQARALLTPYGTKVQLGSGSKYAATVYLGLTNGAVIDVEADFEGSFDYSDAQITITLARGLGFETLPGCTGASDGNWQFSTAALNSTPLDGLITGVTVTEAGTFATKTVPGRDRSGTAVLDIKPGVSRVEFSVFVKLDSTFLLNNNSFANQKYKEILNAVTVAVSQKDTRDSSVDTDSVTLDQFIAVGGVGPVIYVINNAVSLRADGASGKLSFYFRNTGQTFANTFGDPIYYKSLKFSITIPAGLEYVSCAYRNTTTGVMHKAQVGPVAVSGGGAAATTLTFTYADFILISNSSIEAVDIVVKSRAASYYSAVQTEINVTSKLLEAKTYDGNGEVSSPAAPFGSAQKWTVTVSKSTENYGIPSDTYNNTTKTSFGIAYEAPGDMAPEDNIYLGGYAYVNTYGDAIASHWIQIDFSAYETVYHARLVRLPVGMNATAYNLTVTYRKTDSSIGTYTPPMNGNYTSYPGSAYNSRWVGLDITTQPLFSHILTITYEIRNFHKDFGGRTEERDITILTALPTAVFGRFVPTTYAAMLASYGITIKSGTANGTWAKNVTTTFNVREKGRMGFSSSGTIGGTSVADGTTTPIKLLGGQDVPIIANFQAYPQAGTTALGGQATGYTYANGYAPAYYARGYVLFIRTMDSLFLKTGTYITLTNNISGQSFTTDPSAPIAQQVTMTETTDNKGWKVYKIELPKLTLGYCTVTHGHNPTFTVNYTATVKTSTRSGTYSCKDLIYLHAQSGNKVGAVNGNNSYFNSSDSHGVWPVKSQYDLFGSLESRRSFSVQGPQTFDVTTYAQVTMDGNSSGWKYYDPSDPSTSLGIGPMGDMEYKVEVINTSGLPVNGYTMLIPIPKAGEVFHPTLTPANPAAYDPKTHTQREAFKWSAWISAPVSITGSSYSYEIKYSTQYVTSGEGADYNKFEAWNPANSRDYRTILIKTANVFVDGSDDSFSFPFEVPDVDPEEYAGLTNTYSALVTRTLGSSTNNSPSQAVALRLQTAAVRGYVYLDNNRNNIYEPGIDQPLGGVQLKAYRQKPGGLPGELQEIKVLYSAADGFYSVPLYDTGDKAWVEVVNPGGPGDGLRFCADTLNPHALMMFERDGAQGELRYAGNPVTFDIGFQPPCTIVFNPNGGSPPNAVRYYAGTVISEAELASYTPEREGYRFVAWYTGGAGGIRMPAGPYTVTRDEIYYAKWEAMSYKLTYWLNDISTIYNVPFDQALNHRNNPAPTVNTREGYRFIGWVDEDGRVVDINTERMPARDYVLYARFEKADAPLASEPQAAAPAPPAPMAPPTPPANTASWSLASLLLMVAQAAIALVMAVALFTSRRREKGKEGEETQAPPRRTGWKLLAMACAAVGIAVFFIMNDLSGAMRWVNLSTIILLVVLAVQGLFTAVAYRKAQQEEDETYYALQPGGK